MQIDKVLLNIDIRRSPQQLQYYLQSLSQECLDKICSQIIDRVNRFNPDEPQIIQQIRAALNLYDKLIQHETFSKIAFTDEQFICSLGFYMANEKEHKFLIFGFEMIDHQLMKLNQMAYCQSINLFKSLSEIYESIQEEYYEWLTLIMLHMIVNNLDLLSVINHKYYFLQCLIQVVNKQKKPEALAQLFIKLRKLYSIKKAFLFHDIDFKILIDILLRTIIDEQNQPLIQETLKLYLILAENHILSKQKYRVVEFHQALKEKLALIGNFQVKQSLTKIIEQILSVIEQSSQNKIEVIT